MMMQSSSRRGWYERKEVQKVTLDWLKMNRHPTEREIELLKLIHERKLVSRNHLEVISPSYRYAGKYRANILNTSIKNLFTTMYIDKMHEKQKLGSGNKPCIVALDRAGSLFLGVPHRQRIAQEKVKVKGREHVFRGLPNYFRHVNGINQLEVDTILLSECSDLELVKWKHEMCQSFHFGNEEISVIPDVYALMRFRGKPMHFYIEYDTGSEDRGRKDHFPTIYNKIMKYRKYKVSELWREHADTFPTILFVTEDDKRIDYFTKKCRENGLKGWGIWHENYSEFIEHYASLV